MATKTIGQLTETTTSSTDDYLEVEQGGESKKTKVNTLIRGLTELTTGSSITSTYGMVDLAGVSYKVNTGAGIIQVTTVSNGTYIKYADGTMIASYIHGSLATTNNAVGNVFYRSTPLTFPLEFVSAPNVINSANGGTGICWGGKSASVTASAFSSVVVGSTNTDQAYPAYIAIGKWKT